MNPFVLGPQDASLQIAAAATVAASGNSATFDLAQGASMPNPNMQFAPDGGGLPMNVVIPTTSYNFGTGDETYAFKVQTSPDGNTWTDYSRVASIGLNGTETQVTAAGGGFTLIGFFARFRYLRVVWTLGGTSPSIVLGAIFLQPYTNPF